MTVRGPTQPPVVRPGLPAGGGGGAPGPAATPQDAMMRLGLLKTGMMMDPQAAVQKLLSFFVLQGLIPKGAAAAGGGAPSEDAAKLAEALKNLQSKEGLPQTGKLDDKTLKVLDKYKTSTPAATEKPVEKPQVPKELQNAARSLSAFRDQSLAAWIKNRAPETPQKPFSSPPPQPNAAGNPATANPSANARPELQQALTSALQQAQLQQNVSPHDVSKGAPQKAEAEARSAQSDGRATREAGEGKPAPEAAKSGQGAKGEDGAGAKNLKRAGQGNGEAEAKPGGRSSDEKGLARGDADQLTAFEDGRGNQATGDEDEEDERRGAALVDDGSGVDEGAYQVPAVGAQLREALMAIEQEPQTDPNRPSTYKATFVFYKPGFYQSRTQAPQILNLKVVKATAYDEVWSQVVEQVNARLRALAPETPLLSAEQVQNALRMARARAS